MQFRLKAFLCDARALLAMADEVTDSKTKDWVVKFRAAVAQNESHFIYGPSDGWTSKTGFTFYVTMEGVANIALATDQIGHGVVSAVLTDIEPESARDYGGWFSWPVIFAVYEERSPHPLPLPTMYWILVEELDARCRIYHFPPDEVSSFLTI